MQPLQYQRRFLFEAALAAETSIIVIRAGMKLKHGTTHTATLEDYGLSSDFELLYTPEAVEADTLQSARENK